MNYQKLYNGLKQRQSMQTRALVIMPERDWKYWLGLPPYADIYIRPHYELIVDIEGLIDFVQFFLVEYSETNSLEKKLCIETIVFPIYNSLTGRNFDTNYLTPLL